MNAFRESDGSPQPLVLICSVELEMAPLRGRADDVRRVDGRTVAAEAGWLGGREVILVAGGMGKANAAHALTAVLERNDVAGVIGFGAGGAYGGSGLELGGVAVATLEHYADEGVATPAGWMGPEGMGIPLATVGGASFFDTFPVDQSALPALRSQLTEAVQGPFATVSTCSGTTAHGAEIAARYGAICENMEGAAYAHVSLLYEVPFLEIRGISNHVEDRDLGGWRLRHAAEAAAAAVASISPFWYPSARPLDPRSR